MHIISNGGVQIIYIISTGEYKYRGVLIIYYTGKGQICHAREEEGGECRRMGHRH